MQHLTALYHDNPQRLLTSAWAGELTALHLACKRRLLRTLDFVLPMVPPELLDMAAGQRETPLFLAVTSGDMDVVRRLLDLGAPINSSSMDSEGLLNRMFRSSQLTPEMLEFLLDRGVDALAESVRCFRQAHFPCRTIQSD
jgi:ankyrin repeat protein